MIHLTFVNDLIDLIMNQVHLTIITIELLQT